MRSGAIIAALGVALGISACGSEGTKGVFTQVASTTATLNAQGPCGARQPCYFYFRWGTGDTYKTRSATQGPISSRPAATSLNITGLAPNTTYRYQLCRGAGKDPTTYSCVGPGGTLNTYGTFTTASTCNLYASPTGSDANGNGSAESPYASPSRLDLSLAPGQTGCLETGSYGNTSTRYEFDQSGTASGQITIMPRPGDTVQIDGFINIKGSYTTLSGLTIDGSNNFYDTERPGTTCPYPVSQALEINGEHDVLEHNDYSQSVASLRGNGIGIGFNGPADGTIIRYNRIHDVGQCQAFDHLIYVASGSNVKIYDNWLYNDPHGFGVQLYPDPTGAHVYDNVVYNAGSGFTVGGDAAVQDNHIDNNVVADSTGLPYASTAGVGITDYWFGRVGTGNTFDHNDVFDNPAGVSSVSAVSVAGNVTTDPEFADAAGDNFQVGPRSPVAGWGLWNGS